MTISRRQILLATVAMLAEAHAPAEAGNRFEIRSRYDADITPEAPKLNMGRSKHGFQKSWRPGKKGRR